MSDTDDLVGTYPKSLRWSSETGQLGYSTYDPGSGERDIEVIELGTPQARFVMDMHTRERGYGMIRVGLYDFRLTPVGSPPPKWPGDDNFKPAIGCWVWNPLLGEFRFEVCSTLTRNVMSALWDEIQSFKEASEDMSPVVHFTGRREQYVKSFGKTFLVPTVDVAGWILRAKIACFAAREPTVKPPVALDIRQHLIGRLDADRKEPARVRDIDRVKQAIRRPGAAPPKQDDPPGKALPDDEIP